MRDAPAESLDIHNNYPPIPASVKAGDIVAVIAIKHPQALAGNRDTPYMKEEYRTMDPLTGRHVRCCYIFLHRVEGQPFYRFGRLGTRTKKLDLDVMIPKAATKQFELVPVRRLDYWRVESTSKDPMMVNGVPLNLGSCSAPRRLREGFPHAVCLAQSRPNPVHPSVPRCPW